MKLPLRAYELVREDETSMVFQYNPLCGLWLYASAVAVGVGMILDWHPLTLAGSTSILLYFAVVYLPALATSREIRRAVMTRPAEISGSRWSFANPLRITIRKAGDTGEGGTPAG